MKKPDACKASIDKYEENLKNNAENNGGDEKNYKKKGNMSYDIPKLPSHTGATKVPVELKRTLEGAIRKVQGFSWGPTEALKMKLIAADQAGKVIIWDTAPMGKNDGLKEKILTKSFTMTCELHPDGKRAFIGGMDNFIGVYDYSAPDTIECKMVRQLEAHDGYIASIKFRGDNTMVSAAGDADIIKWDVTTYKPVTYMSGHNGDACCIRFPRDTTCHPDRFVTCSSDRTARMWDLGCGKQTHCFALTNEANTCAMFPNGMMIAVGCHDGKTHIFDVRSHLPLQTLARKNNRVAGCDFSKSGRLLLTAYEDGHVGMWDPFKNFGAKDTQYDFKLDAHFSNNGTVDKMISKVDFNYDGSAFATAAYDAKIKVWAPKDDAAAAK